MIPGAYDRSGNLIFELTREDVEKDYPYPYSLCIAKKIPAEVENQIVKVILPEGATKIGDHAFLRCTFLSSIELPDSLTMVGVGAFAYCLALSDISLPQNLQTIKANAFNNCISLNTISFPDSLVRVEEGAFYRSALETINMSDNLKEIGYSAFYGCPFLESVHLPDALSEIGCEAFAYCNHLSTVNYMGTTYTSRSVLERKWKEKRVLSGDNVFLETKLCC